MFIGMRNYEKTKNIFINQLGKLEIPILQLENIKNSFIWVDI